MEPPLSPSHSGPRHPPDPWLPGLHGDQGAPPRAGPTPSWFLPKGWDHGALALYVWGRPRTVVHRLVLSMARSLDAKFLWLEVTTPGTSPEPLERGWIPPERLFLSEAAEDLEPAKAVGNLALWSIVRSDEPSHLLARLTDFVRLPPLVQEVLGQVGEGPAFRAVAVGNADRVAHLFLDNPEEIRWLLGYLRESGVGLVVGSASEPGAGRTAFDAEFHVDGSSTESWREATVVCDRARPGADYSVGRQRRLGELPGLSDLFTE